MTRDAANQDKLDAFSRMQDSLKGRKLKVQDHLDLAHAAREAGLVREAKHNILLAGELDQEDPLVAAALAAELEPTELKEWQEAHKKEIPFWRDLKSILLYPANREGLMMLGTASVLFSSFRIFEFLVSVTPWLLPLGMLLLAAGGVLGLFTVLVLPGFYTAITWRTALGRQGFPDWPGFSDVFANLLGPALKALVVAAWSFMPFILTLTYTVQKRISPSLSLAVFTLLLGLLYFPMSFLMMVMSQKLWPSLLPSQVLDSMVKAGKDYWLLCLFFWLLQLPALAAVLLWPVPLIGAPLAVFTGLYCWACSLHLLGRFYRYEKDKLKWF
jgi:hypothetical protein